MLQFPGLRCREHIDPILSHSRKGEGLEKDSPHPADGDFTAKMLNCIFAEMLQDMLAKYEDGSGWRGERARDGGCGKAVEVQMSSRERMLTAFQPAQNASPVPVQLCALNRGDGPEKALDVGAGAAACVLGNQGGFGMKPVAEIERMLAEMPRRNDTAG